MFTRSRKTRLVLVVLALLLALCARPPVSASGAVVHTILFYSPTCPHCHDVISKVLPPLSQRYGDRLQIAFVDVRAPDGQAIYQRAVDLLQIDQQGVPVMSIGTRWLIGTDEIATVLPELIEQQLAQGGVGWPGLPGVEALVHTPAEMMALLGLGEPGANMPVVAMPAVPERSVAAQPEATVPGHELALVVLGLLALALGRALLVLAGGRHRLQLAPPWQHALVPVLALAGLGVASYLAAVELKHTAAICGPVGDCNTVQQSAYARLFGLIPMGFLGVGGYLALLALWLTGRRLAVTRGRSLQLSMLALVLGGALFSFYLTVLELFVIKAVCLWCLSSAVIMAALLWLIGTPGRQVLRGSGTQKAARG